MPGTLPPMFLAPRLYTQQPYLRSLKHHRTITTCQTSRTRPHGQPLDQSRSTQSPFFRCTAKPTAKLRHFHASSSRRDTKQDHYAVLSVSPGASQSEIKKQFYKLSKTHHPDRNPDNQEEASKKFVAIGDAWSVLGDPTKRDKYDRENGIGQGGGGGAGGQYAQRGSYSSSSPGGRPASGLSRRRGQFRGPPPSFYRSGGWGASEPKRRRAAEGDGRTEHERAQQRSQEAAAGGADGQNREGSEGWPFNADPNDVPHFDRARHYKSTSSVEEQLRQGRRKRRRVIFDDEPDIVQEGGGPEFRSFVAISGVLAFGLTGSMLFWGVGSKEKEKKAS